MYMSFFELKYSITEDFYYDVIEKNFSFEQAGGRCWEAFMEYISSDSILAIVAISTIMKLQIRHKVPLREYDIKDIERVFKLMRELPISTLLEINELKYLETDIKIIKESYNEFLNK